MAAEVVRSTPTWDEREIVERRWGGGGMYKRAQRRGGRKENSKAENAFNNI